MLKVEIIGNLGADAQIKESNGSKFVTMRIAHTDRWRDDQGNVKESTSWVDVTMNDTESKVIPYLKQGVKLFVRGNASLRVYSSPKDRMMKAGLQVAAWEIELCGGNSDAVPRQVVDPLDGTLHDTQKFYWCDASTKGMKVNDVRELVDTKGNVFLMNNKGFVAPQQKQGTDSQVQQGEQVNSEKS